LKRRGDSRRYVFDLAIRWVALPPAEPPIGSHPAGPGRFRTTPEFRRDI